jgi:hypothetical protein
VAPEDVVITVGGVHALFLIAYILCDRGDETMVMSPAFPPARNMLDIVGANVRVLRLFFDRGYQIDLADFRAQLSPRTKLVSLASPQNPSGVSIPARSLRSIIAMMIECCPGAYLLIDETYREAAYGMDAVAGSAIGLGSKVISVSSLSKCHGAPGLRLGWAITKDAALRRQLVLGKFNTVLSCSPIDEAHGALSDMGIGIGDGRWFGDDARVLRLGFGYHPMPVLQAALDALAVAIRRAARAAA